MRSGEVLEVLVGVVSDRRARLITSASGRTGLWWVTLVGPSDDTGLYRRGSRNRVSQRKSWPVLDTSAASSRRSARAVAWVLRA